MSFSSMIFLILFAALIVTIEFTEWHVDMRNMQKHCHEHLKGACIGNVDKLCKNCPYRIKTHKI